MKKVILSFILIATFSTACKKTYTCTCSNPASPGYNANTFIITARSYKKDAQTWCGGFQTISGIPPQTTCTLK
ncbi:MAG TPA: hypothetical protein VNY73_05430 [Bacteroidia bacterium]|jgi:hypothetical protein|nr:hypothetical protein [Bacteroidia bacterium]